MSIDLHTEWRIDAHDGLRCRAVLRNRGNDPVVTFTALRRLRLDGSMVHDDPSFVFVELHEDALHLSRRAFPSSRIIPGIVPPDLVMLEPGEERCEQIALALPLREQNPLHAPPPGLPPFGPGISITRAQLTIGFVPHWLAQPFLRPLGAAHPGVSSLWPGKDLTPVQRLVHARLVLSEPLEALPYARFPAAPGGGGPQKRG